jgi:hypothetical protein
MEGGGIHLIVRAGQTRMAFLTGFWFPRFFRVKGMRGMTTVAPVLNSMASLTKCLFQRGRKGLILTMLFHSVPGDGMPSFLELIIFFLVALGTDLGFNRRFLGHSLLVAFMTSNTIDLVLGMFAVHPRLKDSMRFLLMASQTVPNLFLGPYLYWSAEQKSSNEHKYLFSDHDIPLS